MQARTVRVLASAFAGLSLAACGVLELTQVRSVGVVESRPSTTIGPEGSEGPGPWREFSVRLSRRNVETAVGLGSTIHLLVFDCRTEADVTIEDIYVGSTALNDPLTAIEPGPSRAFLFGRFYIREAELRGRSLCAIVRGGTMFGWRLYGGKVRLPI